jgi:hypothetical protein
MLAAHRMEKIRNIIALLEGVLRGAIPANDALQRWPNIDTETDDAVAQAWHDLSHYASDADIRQRDHEYVEYQRALLKSHIDKLKKNYSIP